MITTPIKPWHVDTDGPNQLTIRDSDACTIARVERRSTGASPSQEEAANVLAAGPHLLEALSHLLSQAIDTCGVIEEFVAMPCESLRDKLPTTVARLRSRIAQARAVIEKAEGRTP